VSKRKEVKLKNFEMEWKLNFPGISGKGSGPHAWDGEELFSVRGKGEEWGETLRERLL